MSETETKQPAFLGVPIKTLLLVIILAITAGLLTYLAISPKNPPADNQTEKPVAKEIEKETILSIENPVKKSFSTYTTNVKIDTGKNNVNSVQLELAYDPTVLRNIEVSPSGFFENPEVLLNSVDEKNGRITFAIKTNLAQISANGIGNVAEISFQRISSKSAEPIFMTFLPKTDVNSIDTYESVLKTTNNLEFNFITPTISPLP